MRRRGGARRRAYYRLVQQAPQPVQSARKSKRPGTYSPFIPICCLCMSRYTKANHRVYMQFVRREVWYVTFLEPGLQVPLRAPSF